MDLMAGLAQIMAQNQQQMQQLVLQNQQLVEQNRTMVQLARLTTEEKKGGSLHSRLITYEGENEGLVVSWLDKAEEQFVADKVSEDIRKIAYAAGALDGAALEWYREQKKMAPFTLWSEFRVGLIKAFQPTNFQQNLRDELKALKQGKNLLDYVTRFRRMVGLVDSMNELD